ncbi:transposase [Acidithiobacillus concretivorus]|uniref:transposase n=1 Tax=Acidithiobacillus concretivorus TaxID=3063952 RepID=UPI001C077D73
MIRSFCSKPCAARCGSSGSFAKPSGWPFFTTDLTLSVTQIIEYYGARWKIEAGFKEIKQEIGSARSQNRTADAVTNHLHFC